MAVQYYYNLLLRAPYDVFLLLLRGYVVFLLGCLEPGLHYVVREGLNTNNWI